MNNCRKTRGDTLIEVLFATAIFSLVAVGGISVMNQGTAASQRALEITMVRNEIDAQAETLRFLNSSYIAAYKDGYKLYDTNTPAGQWKEILVNTAGVTNATDFNDNSTTCGTAPKDSFILNTRKAKVGTDANMLVGATTYSQVEYGPANDVVKSRGVWIEAVSHAQDITNGQGNASYTDFHIRACWDSPGQSIPVRLGTIVRLYNPLQDPTAFAALPPSNSPILTPTSPSFSSQSSDATYSYFSWSGVDCDSGYTPSYSHRYRELNGFVSDWITNSKTNSYHDTSNQGYEYIIDVRASCVDSDGSRGDWSRTSSASFTRPLDQPTNDGRSIAWSILKTANNKVDLSADYSSYSCPSTDNVYLYSRMDVYLPPSYGGGSWYWNETGGMGGWHFGAFGAWSSEWGYHSDRIITSSVEMNPLWTGFPWKVAVELECRNNATGVSSEPTARQESGDLITP